jgi:putative NADH-flavin reductase
MRVLVLVGGETGRLVAERAAADGHETTALVDSSVAMRVTGEAVEILTGDFLDPMVVEKAVVGKDAVISMLTVANRRPTTRFSDVAAALIEAMTRSGVRRLVCLSTSRVDADGPGISPPRRLYTKLIIHRRHHNTLNDFERMEAELGASDLDWTVIRPAREAPLPPTGRYRVGLDTHVPHGTRVSPADVADYIVRHLTDRETYGRTAELAR